MRILICDDQTITSHGLELMLNLEEDMDVVGIAMYQENTIDPALKIILSSGYSQEEVSRQFSGKM